MTSSAASIRVLCVDDNRMLAEAIETQLAAYADLTWAGWLENVPNVVERVREARPDVVLMDIDMPGPDPFASVAELASIAPEIRVLMFSAYVRQDYIDRAIESGAWGYVSKNENMNEVIDALRRVSAGDFVLTSEALTEQRIAE